MNKVVPVEPTEAMMGAGRSATYGVWSSRGIAECYAAMLAAAPTPSPDPELDAMRAALVELRQLSARCRRLAYPVNPPIFIEIADAIDAALKDTP